MNDRYSRGSPNSLKTNGDSAMDFHDDTRDAGFSRLNVEDGRHGHDHAT